MEARTDTSPLAWPTKSKPTADARGCAVAADTVTGGRRVRSCLQRLPGSVAASRRDRGGVEALRTWGAGSTGSRLVTGNTELHEEFEGALAEFVGTTSALVFSSGYTANLAAVVALSGAGSLVVSDARSHASLVDACRLSRARVVVTPHRDVDAVDAALAARHEHRAVVVTDPCSPLTVPSRR